MKKKIKKNFPLFCPLLVQKPVFCPLSLVPKKMDAPVAKIVVITPTVKNVKPTPKNNISEEVPYNYPGTQIILLSVNI